MNNRHLLTINHHIPALLVLLLLFIAGFTAISDAFPLNPSLTAPTYHHDPEITPSFNDFRIYTHNRSTTYDPQSTDRTRAPPAVRTELHQLNLEYYHDDAEGSTVAPKRGGKSPRMSPGTVRGGDNLSHIEGKWLRGTHGSAGKIPKQVGDKLKDREFNNFDEFRNEFWKTVATDSDLSKQFSPANITRMKSGLAPIAPKSQQLGGQKSYILHHQEPIQHGGDVFNLDNLVVVSPRYHKDILKGSYHF